MACIVNAPSSVDIIYGRSVSHAEPKLKELPFLPPVIDRLAVAAADLRRFLARVHKARDRPRARPARYQPTEAFNPALPGTRGPDAFARVFQKFTRRWSGKDEARGAP